jgi:hypothetical protein
MKAEWKEVRSADRRKVSEDKTRKWTITLGKQKRQAERIIFQKRLP